MKSTSPPVSVQAKPVATPGRDVRNATSFLNRAGPEIVVDLVAVDDRFRRSGRASGGWVAMCAATFRAIAAN